MRYNCYSFFLVSCFAHLIFHLASISSRPLAATPPTDCGISDEGLLVLQHGVNSQLLAILCRYDGYGGLLIWSYRRHLLNHLDLLILVMDACVCVVFHKLDKATLLQRLYDQQHILFAPAVVPIWGEERKIYIYIFIFISLFLNRLLGQIVGRNGIRIGLLD